jgi:hypothetical protein
MTEALAFSLIYDAYTERLLYHYYSDDAPVPPGIDRFDLHPYHYVDGKPADYRSDRKGPHGKPRPIGSRLGPQNMVVCGWGLQALKQFPGLWEKRYKDQFKDDVRVLIDPGAPERARRALPASAGSGLVRLGNLEFGAVSTRSSLLLFMRPSAEATLDVFSRPDGQGRRVTVTVKEGSANAVTENGDRVQGGGALKVFELVMITVPYTVNKGAAPWGNGVEHGRISIRANGQTRNLYLASSEADVKAALERELAGGLRTWEAIFDEKGFIPTGIGTMTHWDMFSDSGGYAHLISAAAQWVLLLEGKADWEVQRFPGGERALR